MREMKDSGIDWIGEIPDEWSIGRVKHAFNRKNEKAMKEDPIILSLARSGVRVRDVSNNEGQVAESYFNYNPVEIDDLLLNPMDLYSGANCSISKVSGVISPAYVNLKSKDGINPVFYDYYFKIQYWLMAFFAHGKGVSYENRWTLNAETLMNYPIVTLSYGEQCNRADYLDEKCAKIDAIIDQQQDVIEKLKAYKLSIITEAVTKGLDSDVPMKDSGIDWIGKIPEHWIVTSMANCTSLIQTGPFGSQLHAEDYVENEIFLINPANIKNGKIVPDSKCSITKEKANELSQHLMKFGDIVFGRRGEMGRCAYVDDSEHTYFCGTGCMKIQCNNRMLPTFTILYMQMPLIKQYLELNSVGTTMANLNASIISGIPTICPPVDEQVDITNYLSGKCAQIDEIIEKKQTLIEKITDYKKSLIYEVVTGKKEV